MSESWAVGAAPAGFLAAWARLVGAAAVPVVPRRRGRPPRVPLTALLATLTFHVMQDVGTLAAHLDALFGTALSDGAWADRRARLPWDVFAQLLQRVLRPKATAQEPDAFWRGWRVVALDGTQFKLRNTPAILAQRPKAQTRRGRAAFAHLTTAVLLEVGLHNPLAAAIGQAGESEWALAQRLLAALPPGALLLADRLYGVPAFVVHAQAACARVGSHFLLRASSVTKPTPLQGLADGTRLIRLAYRDRARPRRIVATIDVREIQVRVQRAGGRTHVVRLWTSLLDPTTAPALALAQLYTERWEQELYFRELKRQIRRTALLQSQTVATAAQEVAALILVSAVLADERQRAADGTIPARRISFAKLLETCVKPLWLYLDLGHGILTETQIAQLVERAYARLQQQLTPPRRARSCLRAVRQPIQAWPRLIQPQSTEGPVEVSLVAV